MLKNTRFFKFFKSLKLRIIALLALCIVISVSLLGVGLLYSYKLRAISIRESEVLGQAKMLANQVVTIGYMDNLNNESAKKLQSQIDMLATILKSKVATKITIAIMDAFVVMKNIINTSLIE